MDLANTIYVEHKFDKKVLNFICQDLSGCWSGDRKKGIFDFRYGLTRTLGEVLANKIQHLFVKLVFYIYCIGKVHEKQTGRAENSSGNFHVYC